VGVRTLSIEFSDDVAAWLDENVGQNITDFVVSLVREQIQKSTFSGEELELAKALVGTLVEITNYVGGWYRLEDIASLYRTKIADDSVSNEKISQILKRLGFTERDRLKRGGLTHVYVDSDMLRLRKTQGVGQMQPEPKKRVG
jgi:hypothetical protein